MSHPPGEKAGFQTDGPLAPYLGGERGGFGSRRQRRRRGAPSRGSAGVRLGAPPPPPARGPHAAPRTASLRSVNPRPIADRFERHWGDPIPTYVLNCQELIQTLTVW